MGISIKPDADSLYFYSIDLLKIAVRCGTNCSYSLKSLMMAINKSSSGRFGVDCRDLRERPIRKYGVWMKRLKLEQFANITVAEIQFEHIREVKFQLQFYCTGTEYVSSGFMSNVQLAVLNATLNLVIFMICNDTAVSKEIHAMAERSPMFETKTKERESSSFINNRMSGMTSSYFLEVAKRFDDALFHVATVEEYFKDYYIGFSFLDPAKKKFDLAEFQLTAVDMIANHLWVVSGAGFKNTFQGMSSLKLEYGANTFDSIEEMNDRVSYDLVQKYMMIHQFIYEKVLGNEALEANHEDDSDGDFRGDNIVSNTPPDVGGFDNDEEDGEEGVIGTVGEPKPGEDIDGMLALADNESDGLISRDASVASIVVPVEFGMNEETRINVCIDYGNDISTLDESMCLTVNGNLAKPYMGHQLR